VSGAARHTVPAMLLIALWACRFAVAADGPSPPFIARAESSGAVARVEIDRDQIALHERAVLTLTLDTPAGENGLLPAIGEKLGEWRVVSLAPRELRRSAGGGITRSADLVIEPFLPGEYEIPALEFRVRDDRGSPERVIRTAPLNVRVESVLDDSDASKQIAGERGMIVSIDTRAGLWWAVGACAGIVLLATGGAITVIRRKRRAPEPLPAQWKVDRLELERLLARMEWTSEDSPTALDVSAKVLAGWGTEAAGLEAPGPMAPPESVRAARRVTAEGLEREIEELRFSGQTLDAHGVRRLGEEVMRVTTPVLPTPASAGMSGGVTAPVRSRIGSYDSAEGGER